MRIMSSQNLNAAAPDLRIILNSPATSYWLRKTIESAMVRDPVDALRDAETLLAVLEERLRETMSYTLIRT